MTGLLCLAAAVFYVAWVEYAQAQPITVAYFGFWSRLVAALTPKHFYFLTVHHWIMVLRKDANGQLIGPSADGEVHEREHTKQWDQYPYSFPIRYLWASIRYGYDKNPYEQEARQAAGEPLR